MSTTPYARVEDVVLELADKWEPLLDLPGMTVEHRFLATVCEDDADRVADTDVLWQYRSAQVRWWLGRAAVFSDDDLEGILVHEYVHVLLGPLDGRLKAGSDLMLEAATENVARALLAAHG